MLKSFKYNSRGEVKARTVFVLRENSSYLEGLDFAYLTEQERSEVQEKLKDLKVEDIPPRGTKSQPIDGYDPSWNKAWRCFKKVSFVN